LSYRREQAQLYKNRAFFKGVGPKLVGNFSESY